MKRISDPLERWESKWADPAFDPWWNGQELPEFLLSAVEELALSPTGIWLDIGCGKGVMTCLLDQMFGACTGADFSPTAIDRARLHAAKVGALARFHVADATRDEVPGGPFDVVFDNGCLHTIKASQHPDYASNIARHLTARGYLLVAHKFNAGIDNLAEVICQGLAGHFSLRSSIETKIGRQDIGRDGLFMVFQRSAENAEGGLQ